jgi:glycosyltransferase involved in cell wall biosynthesis
MLPPPDLSIVCELESSGVAVRYLCLRKSTPWKVMKLPGMLRSPRPDIVHAHLFHANMATRICAPRRHPLINTVHNMDMRARRRWLQWVDRASRGLCDVHTAVSAGVQALHAERIAVPARDIPVIYNGIRPPAPLGEAARTIRKEWGVDDCGIVLGSVGRLVSQKGFDRLIRFLPWIASRERTEMGLVILGEGPERNALKELARSLPGTCRVRLPGFRPDAAACISAFDMLVAPSRFEGFGLVVAEGMALGIPILASDIPPFREVADGYPCIRFVDFSKESPSAAADAFADLLAHGGTEPFLPFSLERMVDAYLELYRSLLDTHRSAPP